MSHPGTAAKPRSSKSLTCRFVGSVLPSLLPVNEQKSLGRLLLSLILASALLYCFPGTLASLRLPSRRDRHIAAVLLKRGHLLLDLALWWPAAAWRLSRPDSVSRDRHLPYGRNADPSGREVLRPSSCVAGRIAASWASPLILETLLDLLTVLGCSRCISSFSPSPAGCLCPLSLWWVWRRCPRPSPWRASGSSSSPRHRNAVARSRQADGSSPLRIRPALSR